jgi:UDP-N-acetylmuramate dehydrogenase
MAGLTHAEIAELRELSFGCVLRNVDLSAISWWRVGGCADLVVRPSSASQLASLLRWFSERGVRPTVIGHTTNLLFDDAGLRNPCIQIGRQMSKVEVSGTTVEVEAGAWVPGFARRLMQAGLSGAEHVCGIPGTFGGLVCMNGGSQRKGIGSSILTVDSLSPDGKAMRRRAVDCDFLYRKSLFQTNGEIIAGARLSFAKAPRDRIRAEMLAILADRRRKFPRKEPNCGSVFKSNPAMYDRIGSPGAAIERLGFKGKRIGGALVSPRHANFIVNTGSARAVEILELIARISDEVEASTGFRMEAEACFVRSDGAILSTTDVNLSELAPTP